jgi:hypothetical protein
VNTVVGPSPPGERVPLSVGGSQAAKLLLFGGSIFCGLVGLLAGGGLPVFLVIAGLLLFNAWGVAPLSEVETDGRYLYVSQLRASARIPLTDVSEVRVGWWPKSFRVIVELRTRTPVGKRIVFRPPTDWMATAYDHRAVRELQALIYEARAAEQHPDPGPS